MADHQFSEGVIYEILSRLPTKSLARFRCVCKQWLKYINDPYLETIHRVEDEPTPIIFQQVLQVHSYTATKYCKISFLRAIQGTTNAQVDPVFEFYYKSPSSFLTLENLVLGSCKGLTLVCYEKNPDDHGTYMFAVINPLTKQHHNLPPIKLSSFMNWFDVNEAAGIGFDDSTSTLKTVFVNSKEPVWPLDVDLAQKQLCTMVHYSGTRSWREIPKTPAYPISGAGVFANGRLHWLVNCLYWWSHDVRKIVWFDVKMEEFGLTDPPKPRGGDWTEYQLVDLNGEVGFAYVDVCIELWVLKKKEWVLHCWFDPNLPLYDVAVSGFWNEEGDVLFTSGGGRWLFVYSLKTGDLLQIDGGTTHDLCEAHIQMYKSSLFSVNYCLKMTCKNY